MNQCMYSLNSSIGRSIKKNQKYYIKDANGKIDQTLKYLKKLVEGADLSRMKRIIALNYDRYLRFYGNQNDEYLLDLDQVKEALSDSFKLIVDIYHHNPALLK